MSQYKAVLFDFFGVISSEVSPRWFAQYFAGGEALAQKQKFMDPADRGTITYDQLLAQLSALSGEPAEDIRETWKQYAHIDPRVVSLVADVKQAGLKTALVSDAVADFISDILKDMKLESLFDTIVISGKTGSVKAEGTMFRIALQRLDVSPLETFFIDDNLININIEAAQKQGIAGFHYTSHTDIPVLRKTLLQNAAI